jgi:hypothetical protein
MADNAANQAMDSRRNPNGLGRRRDAVVTTDLLPVDALVVWGRPP